MRIAVKGEINVWIPIYHKDQMECGLSKEDEHPKAGWRDLSKDLGALCDSPFWPRGEMASHFMVSQLGKMTGSETKGSVQTCCFQRANEGLSLRMNFIFKTSEVCEVSYGHASIYIWANWSQRWVTQGQTTNMCERASSYDYLCDLEQRKGMSKGNVLSMLEISRNKGLQVSSDTRPPGASEPQCSYM